MNRILIQIQKILLHRHCAPPTAGRNDNLVNAFLLLIFLIIFSYAGQGRVSAWDGQSEYAGSGFRDPFESQLPEPVIGAPVQAAATEEEQIQLPEAPVITVESQISGGPIPQVIIGGKIFRVGDKVQEALIIRIDREGVEVLYQGRTFLFPAPSRKYAQTERGKDE